MQQTEQFIEKRTNLPTFQAQVGEGAPRNFSYDAILKRLYTDVESTNEQGGYDSQVEVCITAQDKNEFAVRCWEMTAAYRAKYDAEAQNSNGRPAEDMPSEGPGIPLQQEEEVSESTPVVPPEQRQAVEDVRQIPAQLTPADPLPVQQQPQQGLLTEDDLMASVIMSNQRAAIDDLHEIVSLYCEDDKAKKFASRIYERIGRLYDDYGLRSQNSGDSEAVR